MKTTLIKSDKRYLSELKEFKNGLPHGVINKTKCDVGGTYCAINCNHNYIVVCPFIDLVDSIERDPNNKYKVFKCYGGVREHQFTSYIKENKIRKIACTYDSLPKLIKWITNKYLDLKDYHLLIDEYHTLLEDLDFRTDAILNLIEEIKSFKHVSFLSATPIDVTFEPEFIKSLPHYKIEWENVYKIHVERVQTGNVNKALVRFIKLFLDEELVIQDVNKKDSKVEELYIFVNSVQSMKQIAKTLDVTPEDVKFCCSNVGRNRIIIGNDYKIESVNTPNKRINFFTKKCFQGCNLFTNNGLVIVASDSKKEHSLVDVSTTMEQIVGRLRFNDEYQNIFRHIMIHFYSLSNKVMNESEFKELMDKKEETAKNIISLNNKGNKSEKAAHVETLNFEPEIVSATKDNSIEYNEMKRNSFIYKHNLKKYYSDNNNILALYKKSDRFTYGYYQN